MLNASSSTLQNYPAFNYASFMSGLPYIGSPVRVGIDHPLPWTTFLILAAVSGAMIVAAARITVSEDY